MDIPGDPPFRISFSAGVAYYPGDGDTPEMLLEAADQRVYQAKRAGRGRVTGERGRGNTSVSGQSCRASNVPSEESRHSFEAIPTEHPEQDLGRTMSNELGEGYDEG